MLNELSKLANLVNFIEKNCNYVCNPTSGIDKSKGPNFTAVVTICSLHFSLSTLKLGKNMNSKKLEIFSKYKKERRGNKLKFKKFLTLRFFF